MANLEHTVKLFEDFKQQLNKPDLVQAKVLVDQLKLALLKLSIPLPGSKALESAELQKELLLAREILEHAVLLSVKTKDIPAFERYFAQVKPYYFDYAKYLPPSQRQFSTIGLNLLRLLAQNRIAEFHSELELLPLEQHQNVYIRHPIALEQFIMEGSYHKVRSARADVPAESYTFFMDILMDTVRSEIADCSERAFQSLPVAEAVKLLQVKDQAQLLSFSQDKRDWTLSGSNVIFGKPEVSKNEIPSRQLIQETLTYAKELERIV
eukprot:Phypoly_transcript_11959.p1 GENE.Phypoly_transcript_11959~~Phypoly_transcript_11959.p1  ORF type:complete len:266 (-),score=33.02 Phypoly_transcript_11959:84-881(-)